MQGGCHTPAKAGSAESQPASLKKSSDPLDCFQLEFKRNRMHQLRPLKTFQSAPSPSLSQCSISTVAQCPQSHLVSHRLPFWKGYFSDVLFKQPQHRNPQRTKLGLAKWTSWLLGLSMYVPTSTTTSLSYSDVLSSNAKTCNCTNNC